MWGGFLGDSVAGDAVAVEVVTFGTTTVVVVVS